MTPNEFSELTGKDMKADNFMEEYVKVDRIYMLAGNLDKQTVCEDYKKHGITSTLSTLADVAEYEHKWSLEKTDKMFDVAYSIIDKSATIDDDDLSDAIYEEAVKLIGRKAAVLYSLEKGYGFNDEDREYLTELVKRN